MSARLQGTVAIRLRRAFTLLEMLVVIGLLMLLLGLSIGAVMRTPTHDRLLSTEQLLSDLLRQARHTARSTGAPVVLTISAADNTVKGVAQVPVWSQSFEDATPPSGFSDWYYQTGSSSERNLGQTGWGLTNPTTAGSIPSDFPTFSLAHNQMLTRTGNGNSTEGFYLCCAIQPPDPTPSSGNGPLPPIPLVLVGSVVDSSATCGLALVDRQVAVQTVQTVVNNETIQASYFCWDLVGWVTCTGPGGTLVKISAVDNTIGTQVALPGAGPASTGPTVYDVNGPIVGGHWEEVGLFYDGNCLQLLRNGQLAAQLPALVNPTAVPGLTATLLDQGQQQQPIYLGEGQLSQILGATTPTYLQGSLDNCRLFRLGTDRPTPLPSGVVPSQTYILQVRPDGVVELSTQTPGAAASNPLVPSAATSNVLTFAITHEATGANGLSVDQVQLTLMPDGSFTSQILPGTATPAVSQ